jgi:hypothetical protein
MPRPNLFRFELMRNEEFRNDWIKVRTRFLAEQRGDFLARPCVFVCAL